MAERAALSWLLGSPASQAHRKFAHLRREGLCHLNVDCVPPSAFICTGWICVPAISIFSYWNFSAEAD